jgi:hypothetical protein
MDEGQGASGTFNLVGAFADRVPEPDVPDVYLIEGEAEEWGNLRYLLIAVLGSTRAPVTSREREQLREVLESLGLAAGS